MTLKHRLNVLPIIADCILYFESDENRSPHREELNLLFRLNFYTMQFSMFAFHSTWNSFILPDSFSFVNNFFQVFLHSISYPAPSFPTAFIYYQTFESLSTTFFIFFKILCRRSSVQRCCSTQLYQYTKPVPLCQQGFCTFFDVFHICLITCDNLSISMSLPCIPLIDSASFRLRFLQKWKSKQIFAVDRHPDPYGRQ